MQSLFPQSSAPSVTALPATPLAERLRPHDFADFVGQSHLVGAQAPLRQALQGEHFGSLIFWGPPGSGKTTLARLIGQQSKKPFIAFSAVLGGVKEVKDIIASAEKHLAHAGQPTLLFVDEIHRFNKAQQDAFLPHVEKGTIILIGSTTENPSFAIIRPLISRARVLQFYPLSEDELRTLSLRAWRLGFSDLAALPADVITQLIQDAEGDGRILINSLETLGHHLQAHPKMLPTPEIVADILIKKTLAYDRSGDAHYNTISAFIKSMRGSDPDAALHYLARMLESGEDPHFICRRMIIFASEDIGNADPRALQVAVAASEAFDRVGLAEGWIPLAHAVTYLASVPKSNASYRAYKSALKDVQESSHLPVPNHLINAPTRLMKDAGFGKGYQYPHNDAGATNAQTYLPEPLVGKIYYEPSPRGFEGKIAEYLEKIRKRRATS